MVKIITDTTSVLPAELAQQYGIPVIPQVIIFGQRTFLEGVELDHAAFMQQLSASREAPKTAAPPSELFAEQFRRLAPLGEPILCLHPSAQVSGTVRSAALAAQDFHGADIRIIDTQIIGSPLATLVTLAAEWAAADLSADEIEARVRDLSGRCRIYFLVNTLEYLARGGRIGGAAALLGSLLQVKPILTFRNGRVDVLERQRTWARALTRLQELVTLECPPRPGAYLAVMHAGASDAGHALAGDLAVALGLGIVPVYNMPPAIVTHAGPGVLGVGFFIE